MVEIVSGARRLPTGELLVRAWRAASGLASLGVGKGDTVALYLRNDFPFIEASLAAGRLGAYPTPVNWHYTEDEARYLFENSGAKVIVIHADLLAPIAAVLPAGVPVLVVETPAEIAAAYGVDPARRRIPEGCTDWSAWLEGFEPHADANTPAPGTIIYTSGTTGRPEGRAPQPADRRTRPRRSGGSCSAPSASPACDPKDIVTVVTGPMYHSAPNAYGLALRQARRAGDPRAAVRSRGAAAH